VLPVKRIQIYIDEAANEALSRASRREHRSKASLIREAVDRQYGGDLEPDPFDSWAGGVEGDPGEIDAVVYDT
jgi:Ribbon-helix-helix protein, copG family